MMNRESKAGDEEKAKDELPPNIEVPGFRVISFTPPMEEPIENMKNTVEELRIQTDVEKEEQSTQINEEQSMKIAIKTQEAAPGNQAAIEVPGFRVISFTPPMEEPIENMKNTVEELRIQTDVEKEEPSTQINEEQSMKIDANRNEDEIKLIKTIDFMDLEDEEEEEIFIIKMVQVVDLEPQNDQQPIQQEEQLANDQPQNDQQPIQQEEQLANDQPQNDQQPIQQEEQLANDQPQNDQQPIQQEEQLANDQIEE